MGIEYLGHFPSGENRDFELKKKKEKADDLKKHGKDYINNGSHYTWLDSKFDGQPPRFRQDEPFITNFGELIPEGYKMVEYIKELLKERKGEAIGIEFGGVGSEAFGEFPDNFFKKTLGVSLIDHRAEKDKSDQRKTHEVIEGDIFDPATYDEINNTLKGQRADLIVERMARGLESVPREIYYTSKILGIWYKLLNNGGVMFVQTPRDFNSVLDKWGKMIKDDYQKTLDFDYRINWCADSTASYTSGFRLIKKEDAPEELPMLDPRELKTTELDSQQELF